MKERGHLKQVQNRPGVWRLTLYLGRDPQTKDKAYKTFTLHGTERQVQKERTRLLAEIDSGKLTAPRKGTLSDYLKRYLETKRPRWRPATYVSTEMACRLYIIPTLGDKRLTDLSPLDVEAALARWSTSATTGEALSANTVRRTFAALNIALNQAVEWELINRNPCKSVKLGAKPDERRPVVDADGGARLLAAAEGTRFYLPVLIALATGLRRGEVLGLRWSDLNPEMTQLTINQAITQAGALISYADPKTRASRRSLPLPAYLTEALLAHKREQAKQRLAWLAAGCDPGEWERGLILARDDGSSFRPSHFSGDFSEFVAKIGLKGFRFHDLRHSHVSQLLAAGFDVKLISERVGHTNVQITLSRYAHMFPGAQARASEKIDEMLRSAIERRRTGNE